MSKCSNCNKEYQQATNTLPLGFCSQKCVDAMLEACEASYMANIQAQLAEAVKLLREGKRQFAPTTTNSDVDMFLKRHPEELKDN
jgi:hypothetical protein